MSRLLRGAALGAAILLSAAACTSAGAQNNGSSQGDSSNVDQDDGGYGDLYYAVYEETGDRTYTSKLLRWDGTEEGEVETVLETQDTRLFHTATITSDGKYLAYAEGKDDGMLKFMDLESKETSNIVDFPRVGDSCRTPAFAPGTGYELLVPGDGVTVHYPAKKEVGSSYAIDDCMPRPAVAEGDDEPSMFYMGDDNEILFMKPDHEVVNTGLGPKATEFLGADLLHELTVSPTGSQVCVEQFTLDHDGADPYSRHGTCQVLFDVATGEIIKHFDGAGFEVGYTGDGLVLRKDGELSYFPKAGDLAEPAETLSEPDELANAQLITVTDA